MRPQAKGCQHPEAGTQGRSPPEPWGHPRPRDILISDPQLPGGGKPTSMALSRTGAFCVSGRRNLTASERTRPSSMGPIRPELAGEKQRGDRRGRDGQADRRGGNELRHRPRGSSVRVRQPHRRHRSREGQPPAQLSVGTGTATEASGGCLQAEEEHTQSRPRPTCSHISTASPAASRSPAAVAGPGRPSARPTGHRHCSVGRTPTFDHRAKVRGSYPLPVSRGSELAPLQDGERPSGLAVGTTWPRRPSGSRSRETRCQAPAPGCRKSMNGSHGPCGGATPAADPGARPRTDTEARPPPPRTEQLHVWAQCERQSLSVSPRPSFRRRSSCSVPLGGVSKRLAEPQETAMFLGSRHVPQGSLQSSPLQLRA